MPAAFSQHDVDDAVPTFTYHGMNFFPRISYLDRSRWLQAGKKLFRHYVNQYGKPDLIHAHVMNHAGILTYQLYRQTGIPYVITEHSSTYTRQLIANWQWPSMQEAAQNSAARIAVSRSFCHLLQQHYTGLDWQFIPNMLSPIFEKKQAISSTSLSSPYCFLFCRSSQPQ